jgi:hypothetical protein
MSPSKQKQLARCGCGREEMVRQDTINANIKRNGVYTCHHCATIKAGKAGKYSRTKEIRSIQSKALWQRPEFREKITAASVAANRTEEYRLAQATHTKSLWESPLYRNLVSSRVQIALSEPTTRERISAGLRKKWEDELYRQAVIGNLGRQKISSLQLNLYEYLVDLGVDFHKEGPATLIGFYSFDCLIPHQPRSILIECQGNYWHSLPRAIRNDRAKFTYINRYFPEYEILYLWEHEFSTKDRVLDRLKLKLGLGIETVTFSFDELSLATVPRDTANDFLSKYHYLTKSRGGNDYGLWHKDKLIAVCRFSPLPRQNLAHQFKDGSVELSRLCVHPNYHKKNLLSWWLAKLVKQFTAIVSYADTTVGHTGAVYKAANFRLHHETPPDYWYVDKDGYVMHKKTLYNRAINLKLTEAEFAEKYGYMKKWGGPKKCFVYER